MSNISEDLKKESSLQHDASTDTDTSSEKLPTNEDDALEENDDPLNTHRQATNETCLQSVLPDYPVTLQQSGSLGNEIYDIAPGENRHPASIMTDKKCEQLASMATPRKEKLNYPL